MTKLSIEEKAKAYDEALKRAIKHHDKDGLTLEQYETIDIIFPELKESKDERIRKEIIDYIKTGTYHKDWVTWLEKQGEQKLTYKDIETILDIENNILHECNDNSQLVIEAYPKGEDYYGEILRRFNNQRIKPQRMISAEAKEAMYAKTAWSEVDERTIKEIDEIIYECPYCESKEEISNWLNSLKQRIGG